MHSSNTSIRPGSHKEPGLSFLGRASDTMRAMEIRVKVKAGAKNDRITKVATGYEVSVRAKAAGGMANESVIALVSRELGVPAKRIRITRGLRSQTKTLEY